MKHPFRFHILPVFTLGAGGLGFALRLWLFSATDEKGLLPAGHIAGTLLFLLSAIILGILFLATRKPEARPINKTALRRCHLAAGLLGFIGLVFNALSNILGSTSKLAIPAVVLSIAGAAAMLWMGILGFRGKKIPYPLNAVLTVALMVETVAQCQVWGAEPQLQVYFFPLMASVFLVLAAYQKTALLAGEGKRTLLAFFSQAAAFFCCLSFNSVHAVFYVGLFFWAAMQVCIPLPRKKEA